MPVDVETELELERVARMRFEELRRLRLADFIVAVSPTIRGEKTQRPTHLARLVHLLESCSRRTVRALSSVTRQHGKTVTIEHAMVWNAMRRPGRTHAYVTYQAEVAFDVSDVVKGIAERAGLEPRGPRDHWHTVAGDEFYFTGIGGPMTGRGISGVLYVDDPHKNREEAESAVTREKVIDWFRSAAISGVHEGASAVVNHSRWHPRDLIGQLLDEGTWEKPVNLPAIVEGPDGDRPLWPEKYSLEFLQRRRLEMGDYDWASLMMGVPRLRGRTVYHGVRRMPMPRGVALSYGIGIDCASTEKSSADWSTAYLGAAYTGTDSDGRQCTCVHVLHGMRKQWEIDKFVDVLKAWQEQYDCRVHWIAGSGEKAQAILMRRLGLKQLHTTWATTDKWQRAQPSAVAWNRGAISVPDVTHLKPNDPNRAKVDEWLTPFLRELESFVGEDKGHDDCVDALASLYALLVRPQRVTVLSDSRSTGPLTVPVLGNQQDLAVAAMLRQQRM